MLNEIQIAPLKVKRIDLRSSGTGHFQGRCRRVRVEWKTFFFAKRGSIYTDAKPSHYLVYPSFSSIFSTMKLKWGHKSVSWDTFLPLVQIYSNTILLSHQWLPVRCYFGGIFVTFWTTWRMVCKLMYSFETQYSHIWWRGLTVGKFRKLAKFNMEWGRGI